MNPAGSNDPFAPEPSAQRVMMLFAILSGVLLLIAHEAIDRNAAWFAARDLRCEWLTLATLPPLMGALTIQRVADRRFWAGLAVYSALLWYLAWYGGRALASDKMAADAVALPLAWVMIASGHVISAWFSVALARDGYRYPLLFDAAWRQVSTLLQVFAYTVAFWLLLWLWAALFRALGILFFEDLFDNLRFIYPVTSLVAGYGLVLARGRSNLGEALHGRILALWRGLLPLAAVLALAFAAALLLRGVQPLWNTRHATQLLLTLVSALVVLSNAAYGKGDEPPPHPLLKRLTTTALLLCPLFVALAAWALMLRWRQYGMSLDRLWAAFSIGIAAIYAVGYALAATRRQTPWLAGIAPVNRTASIVFAVALLLTQTGVLDFRAMTAHSLRARAAQLTPEDWRYLRWQLGSPGVTVLQTLQQQYATSQPERAATIGHLLAQDRDQGLSPPATPAVITYQQPTGAAPPPAALLDALSHYPPEPMLSGTDVLPTYWLIALDVDGHPPVEWLRLTMPVANRAMLPIQIEVFQQQAQDWRRVSLQDEWLTEAEFAAAERAIREGTLSAIPPRLWDLQIGTKRLRLPVCCTDTPTR